VCCADEAVDKNKPSNKDTGQKVQTKTLFSHKKNHDLGYSLYIECDIS